MSLTKIIVPYLGGMHLKGGAFDYSPNRAEGDNLHNQILSRKKPR